MSIRPCRPCWYPWQPFSLHPSAPQDPLKEKLKISFLVCWKIAKIASFSMLEVQVLVNIFLLYTLGLLLPSLLWRFLFCLTVKTWLTLIDEFRSSQSYFCWLCTCWKPWTFTSLNDTRWRFTINSFHEIFVTQKTRTSS